MMKYNINIVIPILNKSYEIFVPNNILVGNLLYMFINSINDLNEGISLDNMLFYDKNTGILINLDDYVFNTIIENGTTLILA